MCQELRMETETCPCPVCRSDMAYLYPCLSPVVLMTEYVLIDEPDGALLDAPTAPPRRKKNALRIKSRPTRGDAPRA
jgi:hypothetical protein